MSSGRSTVTSPPQNSLGRRQHRLLLELGYTLASRTGGGHFRYEHPACDPYDVSGTSYDRTAWQSFLSEMRKRHPGSDHPVLRPRKSSRPARPYRRRSNRTPVSLLPSPAKPAEPVAAVRRVVAPPGSGEAVSAGCICPVFENNRGEGIDGQPGVFVYVVGCPYHVDETQPRSQSTNPVPRCECGNQLPQRKKGRPRKYCFSCRPSKWDQATEEQRERSRQAWQRWHSKHVNQEAA